MAALAKTPDAFGAVEVCPPGVREHAVGFTVKVSKLDPHDVAGFCRDNPIFHPTDLEPPADLSFADKAAYLAVLRGMKDWDRALLYEKGGMPLIPAIMSRPALGMSRTASQPKADRQTSAPTQIEEASRCSTSAP